MDQGGGDFAGLPFVSCLSESALFPPFQYNRLHFLYILLMKENMHVHVLKYNLVAVI